MHIFDLKRDSKESIMKEMKLYYIRDFVPSVIREDMMADLVEKSKTNIVIIF